MRLLLVPCRKLANPGRVRDGQHVASCMEGGPKRAGQSSQDTEAGRIIWKWNGTTRRDNRGNGPMLR